MPDDVSRKGRPLVLMEKPGSQLATFTEAGQDIEQLGDLTFYSANADTNTAGVYEGSVHLFRNGQPLETYRAHAGAISGARMGYTVGMSNNWLVTDLRRFPVAPGRFESALMVIGKSGSSFVSCGDIAADGTMPNCVTCTGSYNQSNEPASTLSCTPQSGIQLLQPTGLSSSFQVRALEAQGDELFVLSAENKIVQYGRSGSSWTQRPTLTPQPGATFGTEMAVSGNRLAVAGQGSAGAHVAIYERSAATANWQFALRITSPEPSVSSFGLHLDLDGNTLAVADSQSTHFFDLVAGSLPSQQSAAVVQTCSLDGFKGDVALSGSSAVLAQSYPNMPATFRRNTRWELQGGVPEGIFPRDVSPSGFPTSQSIWGASIDADRVSLGWRNYRGENNATETGAALGFSLVEQDCGNAYRDPAGEWQRGIPLVPVASYGPPEQPGHPFSAMFDGSTSTTWEYPQPFSSISLRFDLGQYETLQYLRIWWGDTYARSYSLLSYDSSTGSFDTIANVTNADGGHDYVDLSTYDAFGDQVVVFISDFTSASGTPGAASIREFALHGKTHELCHDKPQLDCSGTAEHVCRLSCGSYNGDYGCYCDDACGRFGDCCSFDGSTRGAQYFSGSQAVCND